MRRWPGATGGPHRAAAAVVLAHLAFQAVASLLVPAERLVAESGHDGSVYWPMVDDPVPPRPEFNPHRYRRLLLPVLVRLLPIDRTAAFVLVGVAASAVSALFLWRLASALGLPRPGLRTVLVLGLPWAFVPAHMGLVEPLMLAGLVAGTWCWLAGPWRLAWVPLALAVLSKETAAVGVLALGAASFLLGAPRPRWQAVALVVLSGLPAVLVTAALAIRWGDPFWFGRGISFSLFGLASALAAATTPERAAHQLVNAGLIVLAVVGLARLRAVSRPLALYCLLLLPVVVLYLDWTVYPWSFDLGRSFLLVWPLALVLPLHGRGWAARAALVGLGSGVLSLYYLLAYSRFFFDQKLLPWLQG